MSNIYVSMQRTKLSKQSNNGNKGPILFLRWCRIPLIFTSSPTHSTVPKVLVRCFPVTSGFSSPPPSNLSTWFILARPFFNLCYNNCVTRFLFIASVDIDVIQNRITLFDIVANLLIYVVIWQSYHFSRSLTLTKPCTHIKTILAGSCSTLISAKCSKRNPQSFHKFFRSIVEISRCLIWWTSSIAI